jgi:uncharacterized protein (TIGR03118 family)
VYVHSLLNYGGVIVPKFARFLGVSVVSLSLLLLSVKPAAAQYKRRDLVSNVKGKAVNTDPNVFNSWGMAFFPHGPFWVANDGNGLSTAYGPDGSAVPLVVTVPPAANQLPGTSGSPTGVVANPTADFVISKNGKSGPALFIFATVDGTISGWNPKVDPTNAVIVADDSGDKSPPLYTGLAIGVSSSGKNLIYAADQVNNKVDVYDGSFNEVSSFTDPNLPPGFAAFGIQNIQGKLYVTFGGFLSAAAGGVIDVFDTDGNFIKRFASMGELDLPWGLALAPSDFGEFSNDLLVGNLSNGNITAFAQDGTFKGLLKDDDGQYISVDSLWAIAFGTDPSANGRTNQLFFTGGPVFYQQGLFGVIEVDSRAKCKE